MHNVNSVETRYDPKGDPYGDAIYTEPEASADTLSMLGPLRVMAGTWEGVAGIDVHPFVDGTEQNTYFERYDLAAIDRQTNGPQLFYGLRYHTHIVKVGDIETFHDQVGYWLWEPATDTVTFSLSIPRGQTLLASGHADVQSKKFEVTAELGSQHYGILSNPFLDRAFKTIRFRISVSIHDDNHWSYEQETLLRIPGESQLFAHTDRNSLRRLSGPVPNPLTSHRR